MKNNYEFNVLHESVAGIDQFPDKTHENVAGTLYDLIERTDEGVTIGLEGGWGSGKSTVVNLLKVRFANAKNRSLVFLFDAWAHEGDPLRRIFLESLIQKIDPENSDEYLQALQNEISGRRKIVEVSTKNSTSKLGAQISLSAVFVPVGAAVLSTIDYNSLLLFSFEGELHVPFILGSLFALAPLIALIRWRVFGDSDEESTDKGWFSSIALGDRKWDIFGSERKEDYTQDITEDGERTSIEFEKYFEKILSHSIGEEKAFARAVVVVDNLDRVEPEQTLAIWSVLQTFFQLRNNSDSASREWLRNLWFLIPFDREGLSQVWKGDNQFEVKNVENLSTDERFAIQPLATRTNSFVTSFLDKCFQVIAEVPEPVMTSWIKYCEDCIHQSLEGWPEREKILVIDTFKRFESRLDTSPTPRQIHIFVNRVGILGMRWGGVMDAEAISLYALLRKDRSDRQLRKELLMQDIPSSYESVMPREELKKQLAGMLFGVEKNKGVQLLLEPEIRSSLHNGDSESLRKLINEQKEAFWVAWNASGSSFMPNGHTEEYRIAVTVAFCNAISGYEHRVTADVQRLIAEWKKRDDSWRLAEYDYSEALSILIKIAPDAPDLTGWLNKHVLTQLKKVAEQVGEKEFNEQSLLHAVKLSEVLENYDQPLKTVRYMALNETKWSALIEALDSQDLVMPYFSPPKSTISALLAQLDISNPSNHIVSILLSTLRIIDASYVLTIICEKLCEWGQNPSRAIGNNSCYEILLHLVTSNSESVQAKVGDCLKTAGFSTIADHEDIASTPALAALVAVVFKSELQSTITSNALKQFWGAEYEPKTHKPVIDLLQKYGKLDLLWEIASRPENYLALSYIIEGDNNSIYASELGGLYIDDYKKASIEDIGKIVLKLLDFGGLAESISTFKDEPVLYRNCLKLVSTHGGVDGAELVSKVLSTISSEDWKSSFDKDMELFDCIEGKADHKFKDAFLEFAIEQLSGDSLKEYFWKRMPQILDVIMDKDDVATKLLTKYFQLEKDPLNDLAFQPFISTVGHMIYKIPQELIVSRIENWLIGSSWIRLSWFLESRASIDIKPHESLESRINEKVGSVESVEKEILLQIASSLNIDIMPTIDVLQKED